MALLENYYQIQIKIASEAIFDSGERERNTVQSKVLSDSYGFVYFHAKTLKGQLKKQAFWLLKQYDQIDKIQNTNYAERFYKSIVTLFGINSLERNKLPQFEPYNISYGSVAGNMRLSNLELAKSIREYFIQLHKEDIENNYIRLSPYEIVKAQTNIRTGIQLEEGVIKKRMFNSYHTVKEDLYFYADITFENVSLINQSVIEDLAKIIYSFRRIGAGIHRGRGEVEAKLLVGDSKTLYCVLNNTEDGGGTDV